MLRRVSLGSDTCHNTSWYRNLQIMYHGLQRKIHPNDKNCFKQLIRIDDHDDGGDEEKSALY